MVFARRIKFHGGTCAAGTRRIGILSQQPVVASTQARRDLGERRRGDDQDRHEDQENEHSHGPGNRDQQAQRGAQDGTGHAAGIPERLELIGNRRRSIG